MSVVKVNEIWQGRDGSGESTGIRRYTRVFRVQTDSNFDAAVEATNHASIPLVGNLFPSDNEAYCQRVGAVNEGFSPRWWIVTANYSTEQELADNPLDDPTEFEWGTAQFQAAYHRDRDGSAILNSAGDPYIDPPVEGDDSRVTVRMTRNVATVPAWFLSVADTLNSQPVTIDGLGIPAERAKIQGVSAGKKQFRAGVTFRTISATIHIQRVSWQKTILDAGYRDSSGNILTNTDGTMPVTPLLLDGSGAKLANPTPITAVYKTYDIYPTFDFNTLPF